MELCHKLCDQKISPRQVDGVVNKTRRRSSCGLHLYDDQARRGWIHSVYYTLVDCNLLTLLLRFVVDLPYNLFTQLCNTRTHTHNRLTALCPGLPEWAGVRRNGHPLTPVLVIKHPLSTSSIYYDP